MSEAENKLAGVVLDPPRRQKRKKNTVGQQRVAR
jgi:hypothetical protein